MCERTIDLTKLNLNDQVNDFNKLKKGYYYYGFRGSTEENDDGTFRAVTDNQAFKFFCGKYVNQNEGNLNFLTINNPRSSRTSRSSRSSRSSRKRKSESNKFQKLSIRPHFVFDLNTNLLSSTKKRIKQINEKRNNVAKEALNRRLPSEMGKTIVSYLPK